MKRSRRHLSPKATIFAACDPHGLEKVGSGIRPSVFHLTTHVTRYKFLKHGTETVVSSNSGKVVDTIPARS